MGKYIIPENTTLYLDTVHLHRNSKYWGNATDLDEFNPSRFDGRNITEEKIVQKDTGDTAPGALTNEKIKMPVKETLFPSQKDHDHV